MAALTQTTLSAAITLSQTTLKVASVTGISAPANNFLQKIYVVDPNSLRGELMSVLAVDTTNLLVTVSRLDEFKSNHPSGALVIINPIDVQLGSGGFVEHNPVTYPPSVPLFTWVVNVVTGEQWLYSSVTNSWVPGFQNPQVPLQGPTVAVASAAGLVTPSGPMFHVTGTAAITGFNRPNGFAGGGTITIVPDAIFTWTAANNIALAGTAVVNKTLVFTYDSGTSKWVPSYIA